MSDNINAIFEDKEFELKSPVHALNFNDNAYVIAGMHLMSLEKKERDKYLKVPEDVTDSSILFFDDRHLFEIGGMLLGILNATINVIHYNRFKQKIINYRCIC